MMPRLKKKMKVPMCENRKPSLTRGGLTVAAHPSHARWKKKYEDLAGWMAAHPGEPAGRTVSCPETVTYFSFRGVRRTEYHWTFSRYGAPPRATVYETVEEWKAARDEGGSR